MDPNTLYTLDRSGQQYGPYTLEQLKTYFREGSVVGTDMVWTAAMPSWTPVSQLLAGTAEAPAPALAGPPPIQHTPRVAERAATPSLDVMGRPADSAGAGTLQEYQRPTVITILAVLQFLGAGAMFLAALLFLFASTQEPAMLIAVVACATLGALELVCGIGLWKLKPYGRTMQQVFAWIGLLGIPLGTIISILILVYLNKPGIRTIFSGVPASRLEPHQVAEIEAITKGSSVVIVAVVAVILIIPVLGIIAAIAVPGLLRARVSGNEASAIGTLRAITSAQASYSVQCNGYAPNLTALNGAGLLSPELGAGSPLTRSGYTITVEVSGPAVATSACEGTVSDYVVRAEPVTPGSTGIRFFATNASGVIYQDTAAMSGTEIPPTATPIQ